MEKHIVEPAQKLVPKRRRCLRCRDKFDSDWAGDRICPRCKQSSAWRAGAPYAAPAARPSDGRVGKKSSG
jgi:hypothetical protein